MRTLYQRVSQWTQACLPLPQSKQLLHYFVPLVQDGLLENLQNRHISQLPLFFIYFHSTRTVDDNEQKYGKESAWYEYKIEPPVIKVETNVTQYVCYDGSAMNQCRSRIFYLPIFTWHIHSNQQYRRNKIHSHNLGQQQHDVIRC